MSAGGMAYAPPGRRRAFRVRSPTTPPNAPERRAEAADSRSDENRYPGALPGVPKQLLSPNRCGFAAARGWPDTYLPVPRQARIRAVWGQCWCVPGSAPSRSMPLGVRWRPKEWLFVNHPILSPKFSQTTCLLLPLLVL